MDKTKVYANISLDVPTGRVYTGIDITCIPWGDNCIILVDQGVDCPKLVVLALESDTFYTKWYAVRTAIADCWDIEPLQVEYIPGGLM